MRNLAEVLSWASGWEKTWQVATKASPSETRPRLGPKPLAALFRTVAIPPATGETKGTLLLHR
ncbi:MAG: transposase domain-containing protein [Actinomycetota bacterium]|nr:transposase domain-containing protein [Actinomycetota bacterium]